MAKSLGETVNNDDIGKLPTAEESFEGTESEEDCIDTEIDSVSPIDSELYSHKYQVIQPKPHILESIKQAKKRIPSQSTSDKSENSDLFQALEVDYAAAAARRLSVAARRKGFTVKGTVSKMQNDMGYGDPARADEY